MFDLFSICTVIVVISIAVSLTSLLLLLVKSRRNRLSTLCIFLSLAIIGISILLIFTDYKTELSKFSLFTICVLGSLFVIFCFISLFPKVLLPIFCVLYIVYYSFSFISISKSYLLPQKRVNIDVSNEKFLINDIELVDFDITDCKLCFVEKNVNLGSLLFLRKCYFPLLIKKSQDISNVEFSIQSKFLDRIYFQTEDLPQIYEINLPMSQFPPYKFKMHIININPFLYEAESLL